MSFKPGETCYYTFAQGGRLHTGIIIGRWLRPKDAFGESVKIEYPEGERILWEDEVWHSPEMAKKYPVL